MVKLADALAHRGPDGQGRYIKDDVGLVQTRLAIIDLATGDQPITTKGPDGREATIVANGEIYNYIELRLDLGRADFKTRSDCELPLQIYLRQDLGFPGHLRGMYALAIHDPGRRRLVLARDPFGVKPLYYVESRDFFAFASEPTALIKAGLAPARLNSQARDEMLAMRFSCGSDTIFEGIRRVLPGETLVVEQGRVVGRMCMDLLPEGAPRGVSRRDAVIKLDELLADSVNIHQRSDVPCGMFLSGGVDSSVVLAMMNRLNENPVTAFTAGFSGTNAHDEREHSRMVARQAGAEHIEVEFGERDFWSLLPGIAKFMDDPAADYAVLPTFKLAAEARRRGLKVILSGEGGDEIFAGYGRYRRVGRWRIFGGRGMRRMSQLAGLGVLRHEGPEWRARVIETEQENEDRGWTTIQKAQALDMSDWLPNDLLTKLDRCLMAHGVEGRVPLLDPKLAAFAYGLPDALKVRRRRGKWLLRKWLEGAMPTAKPFAPKRGFTVPVGNWMAARSDELGKRVSEQPGVQEVCKPGAVRALFKASGKRETHAAWTLLFYALWHRCHIVGDPVDGGVMDALGAAA